MGNVQILMTFPLWSCLNVSAIDPDPTVNGHDPATPARKRNTISIDRLDDPAAGETENHEEERVDVVDVETTI